MDIETSANLAEPAELAKLLLVEGPLSDACKSPVAQTVRRHWHALCWLHTG